MPDCWISNEAADSDSLVSLARRYQPNPNPQPVHQLLASDHQMIGSSTGAGDLVSQRFGWGPGRLTVNLPMIEQAQLDGLRSLYFSWTAGKQDNVQFCNGAQTWICAWDGPWEPERKNLRRALYKITLKLLIKSEVLPEVTPP